MIPGPIVTVSDLRGFFAKLKYDVQLYDETKSALDLDGDLPLEIAEAAFLSISYDVAHVIVS